MTEESNPSSSESSKVIRGENITAILFGGSVFLLVVGCGVLNILAAMGKWNPFHWQGRFWMGVFMVAAPAALAVMAALPAELRKKVPDQVITLSILVLWVAFFWAACGGH